MPLIKFNVRNQLLRQYNSVVVAANSSNYLKLQFNFLTEDWASVGNKSVYIISQNRSEPFPLNEYNQIFVPTYFIKPPCFSISVFGGGITTNMVEIPVVDNGYRPSYGPDMSLDMYNALIERIDQLTLNKADNIIINEDDNTIQLSANGVPVGDPVVIDMADCGIKDFIVDEEDNITIILDDGRIIDLGRIEGASGVTFIPHVDENGILTWENNGGLENPRPIDLNCRDEWYEDTDDYTSDDYLWEDE